MTLRTLLDALPDTALVPVGWLRSQLDAEPVTTEEDGPDLSVTAFAKLVGRSSATVRSWCERGAVPGSYRLPGVKRRGAWRIPAASVAAFRAQCAPGPRSNAGVGVEEGGKDLRAWRRVVRHRTG